MGDEPTTGETRAQRIKRKWDEGEPERAALRAEREAARQPEREAVGLLRRMGHWRLLYTLITLAAIALPAVVAWAAVDSDLWAKVLGGTIGLAFCLAIVVMSVGTKYRGDY